VGETVLHYTIFNTPFIKTILRGISLFFLRILGWKEIGKLPEKARYLMIVAPHTSNWDLFYGLIVAFALKLDARFMAKKELFRWPFSPLIRWMGGLPIDRTLSSNVVDRMIHEFEVNEKFVLAIAPEGTRHKSGYWKSGFYYIAKGAHVPIQLAFIDYASKTGGYGPLIYPTGDIDRDMSAIRDFYLPLKGKHHDLTSTVAIRPPK
jgi:1-acyl-sn-glycerol-3-phosphate acyltransferase